MASSLYDLTEGTPEYFKDRRGFDCNKLKESTTLYIGNLSFFTTEIQLYELFSRCGELKKVIMGLNKQTKTPCGFCFVEYCVKEDATRAVNTLNNTMLDNRSIRADWDTGFEEGRQYGRGWSGAQKRDDISHKYDPERPKEKIYTHQKRHREHQRDDDHDRNKYKKRRNNN